MARLSKDDEAVRDVAAPVKYKRVIPDAVLPKLLLIVHPSGSKSWALRTYPRIGVPSTRSIGSWPAMTVDAARKAALLDTGKNNSRTGALENMPTGGHISVAAVAKDFIVRHVEHNKLRTQDEIQRVLDKYILPEWGERPLTEIKRADVTKLVDHVADAHGKRQAEVVFAYIRKLMSWHAARSDDYNSPVVTGMRPRQRRARSRVLSDDEIKALWRVASQLGSFGAMCQVLLLSGQRLAKVALMRHEDVVNGVWVIATDKGEKGNAETLPLPPMVRRIIAEQPVIVGRPFVFACAGYRDIHKRALDKLMRAELGGLEPFVIHDLRRTARSLMARAGVPRDHAERVLGHALPGVEGTYNRHSYQDEKAAALRRLAAEVARIVAVPQQATRAASKAAGATSRRVGRR
jgi:integrase